MRWGWIFMFAGATAWGATINALSLDKQKIGDAPAGFTALHKGPGMPGAAKVVELNDGKQRAVEITGGDATSNHYTLYRLDRVLPGDHNASVKFRFLGGKGVQSAGVFFRMQPNRNDYYLLAVKPKDRKLYWTVFKDNVPVKGVTGNQIIDAHAGWHELSYTCRANRIDWQLNGRKDFIEYKPQFVPDYGAGQFGFWVRSDTRVQFTGLNLPVPEAVVQKDKHNKLIENLVLGNKRLRSLQLIAPPWPGEKPVVVASLLPAEITQPALLNTLKAMDTGKTVHQWVKDKKIRVVNLPLRGSDGQVMGAVRLRLTSNADDAKLDLNFAAKIVQAIRQKIPNAEALSIFP